MKFFKKDILKDIPNAKYIIMQNQLYDSPGINMELTVQSAGIKENLPQAKTFLTTTNVFERQ